MDPTMVSRTSRAKDITSSIGSWSILVMSMSILSIGYMAYEVSAMMSTARVSLNGNIYNRIAKLN